MKNKPWIIFMVVVYLIVLSHPVLAHHGFAPFDMEHQITIKGTVTRFEFINPHAELYLNVKDDKGNVKEWDAESNSPNMMARVGWTRNSLKPGDEITIVGNPAKKSGSNLIRLQKVIFADGHELLPYPAGPGGAAQQN